MFTTDPHSINLQSIYLSGIGLLVLIVVLAVLFYKLRNVTFYNVAIFMFLATFWIVATLIKKAIYNDNPFKTNGGWTATHDQADGLDIWIWPVIFASFQLIQVLMRFLFGRLGKKMKSRKWPILIAASASTLALVAIIASNIAPWSIAVGMIAAGFLGSTFGMQNVYWSENYNTRSVYISMGIIAIIPAIGSLGSSFIKSMWKNFDPRWADFKKASADAAGYHGDAMRTEAIHGLIWVLVGFTIFMVLVSLVYAFFFKEKKETIGLDNIDDHDHHFISRLGYKDFFRFATLMMAMSFGFNLVTAGGTSQEQTTVWISPEFIILTIVGIAVSIVTAFYLARVFRSRTLLLLGDVTVFLALIMAMVVEWTGNGENKFLWMTYLILMTIGFNVFQNTYLGLAIHVAHKNPKYALISIFCLRSLMYGTGQATGEYVRMKAGKDGHWVESASGKWAVAADGSYTMDAGTVSNAAHKFNWQNADYVKYLIIPALCFSIISMIMIYRSNRNYKIERIYNICDKYEYDSFKNSTKVIWKSKKFFEKNYNIRTFK